MRTIRLAFQQIFLSFIAIYRYCISPLLGYHCRFTPSCSEYAAEAVRTHGLLRGVMWSIWRVVRCHPWGGHGHDPVPLDANRRR